MGQTKTNNLSVAYAEESTPGVLGGSPSWFLLEPNNLPTFGAEITTVSRTPISKRRQRRKGKTTDLSSTVEIEHDTTLDPMEDFLSAFVAAQWQGTDPQDVLSCDADSFTTADNSITFTVGDLIHVRGMANAANNGVHVVNGVPSSTDHPVATSLTAEGTAPVGATIERAGIRGATGDLQIDASGNLISTVLDFTTLPIIVGQTIWIGGEDVANQFTEQVNSETNYGYARVTAITANQLTLSKKSYVFVTDAGAGKDIDLFFGRVLKNVDVDDALYVERTYHFEAAYDNLGTGGVTEYEYAIGNYANELTLNLPETDKSTVNFGFIGQDTEVPTTVRKTGAASAETPVRTDSFSTSTDIARIRVQELDETGLSACIQTMTFTIQNNVEVEKCLGNLGSSYVNLGNFFVNIEMTALFTNSAVTDAIRNNETVSMDFALDNDDGSIVFDIPAMTLGDGSKEFPQNRSITISLTGEAYGDSTYNASVIVSLFPFVPV